MNDKAHYFFVAGRRMPDGTVLLEIDDDIRAAGGYSIYDHTDERWHNCEQPEDYEAEEAIGAELARRIAHQAPPVTEVTSQKLTDGA